MHDTETIVDRSVMLKSLDQMGFRNVNGDQIEGGRIVREAAPFEARHQIGDGLPIEWGTNDVTAWLMR